MPQPRKKDCPVCKTTDAMQDRYMDGKNEDGSFTRFQIWRCDECGHIERQRATR